MCTGMKNWRGVIGGTGLNMPLDYQNRPVNVTGKQTGVANPIDTAKATERLRLARQQAEGIDPDRQHFLDFYNKDWKGK
jgi:hypothetical protein|tara:strand:+ start:37 stop:273 length:237 start_codon:yes stop_codon:yes gene_type:complete